MRDSNLEAKKRIEEYQKKKAEADENKKKVVDKVQKLAAKHSIGEISFNEYNEEINKSFGEWSPEKWVEYYDSYSRNCERYVKNANVEIRRKKTKIVVKLVLPILFLSFDNTAAADFRLII